MTAIMDLILKDASAAFVLLVSAGILGFYLKGVVIRVSSLEKIYAANEAIIGGLVTKSDLTAQLDKFELRLNVSLADVYMPRLDYERRHADLSERITALSRRIERHEEWHQEIYGWRGKQPND